MSKSSPNRHKHLHPDMVHPDQTGFIMGREAQDNSSRALQLIHWTRTCDPMPPYLIHSTDAEKVFDRVDWGFLKAVLTRVGLGPQMLWWISALYESPSAQVKVNDCLSSVFPIRNCTRQGGLSPLLGHPPQYDIWAFNSLAAWILYIHTTMSPY